jgi:hypothetical protein
MPPRTGRILDCPSYFAGPLCPRPGKGRIIEPLIRPAIEAACSFQRERATHYQLKPTVAGIILVGIVPVAAYSYRASM